MSKIGPRRTPAVAERAAPKAKVMMKIWFTSIPIRAAVFRSEATARMALPRRDPLMSRLTRKIIVAAETKTKIFWRVK